NIHLVENGQVKDVQFSSDQFEYVAKRFPEPVPAGLPYAGLRMLFPVNLPSKQDEVAAFVGASYFRLLGKNQRYGMSARAVALNTADSAGEEFPRFTEFWIEKPSATAGSMQFHALLDS